MNIGNCKLVQDKVDWYVWKQKIASVNEDVDGKIFMNLGDHINTIFQVGWGIRRDMVVRGYVDIVTRTWLSVNWEIVDDSIERASTIDELIHELNEEKSHFEKVCGYRCRHSKNGLIRMAVKNN